MDHSTEKHCLSLARITLDPEKLGLVIVKPLLEFWSSEYPIRSALKYKSFLFFNAILLITRVARLQCFEKFLFLVILCIHDKLLNSLANILEFPTRFIGCLADIFEMVELDRNSTVSSFEPSSCCSFLTSLSFLSHSS